MWDDPRPAIFDRLDQSGGPAIVGDELTGWSRPWSESGAARPNRVTRNQGPGEMAAAMISETEYKVNQELSYTVVLPGRCCTTRCRSQATWMP